MPYIKLQTLGLGFDDPKFELWDEGFVSDTVDHTKKIYRKVMGDEVGLDEYIAKNILSGQRGFCMDFIYPAGTLIVIACQHAANHETDIFNKAHEETHALHIMNRLNLLDGKLADLGVHLNLSSYPDYYNCPRDDAETVANIGGVYALHNSGKDILRIPVEQNPQQTQRAISQYQKALRMVSD